VLGYAAGVVDIVDGAAAALNGLRHPLAARETTLVPELEREADEGMSLGVEERSDGRRAASARHGDSDGVIRHVKAPPFPLLMING